MRTEQRQRLDMHLKAPWGRAVRNLQEVPVKSRLVYTLLAIAVGSGLITATSHAQDTNAYLYLVHAASGRNFSQTGNPELPVDISINGTCVIKGISFGEIRGPYTAPAGTLNFIVSTANSLTPCSNPAIFTAPGGMSAGNTYLGAITLNTSNALTGNIYPLDLSSVAPGMARALVLNATTQNLSATVTSMPTTDGSGGQFSVPAGTLQVATPPVGVYYTSVYIDQTDMLQAGPVQIESLARNAYIYVFAGSAANGTVQLLGPKMIHGVF
jgi:hypothetical protein